MSVSRVKVESNQAQVTVRIRPIYMQRSSHEADLFHINFKSAGEKHFLFITNLFEHVYVGNSTKYPFKGSYTGVIFDPNVFTFGFDILSNIFSGAVLVVNLMFSVS